jgi:hypothetical protein
MQSAKSSAAAKSAGKSTNKTTVAAKSVASKGKSVVKPKTGVAAKTTGLVKKSPMPLRKVRDPSHRGMADPWFSLAAAGLKTKDIRQINMTPRPGMTGPAPLGYDSVKVGDVITWANWSIGVERTFKAKIVSVTPCASSEISAIMKKKGESVKYMPTLTPDQACEITNRLLHIKEGEAEKQFVCLEFVVV